MVLEVNFFKCLISNILLFKLSLILQKEKSLGIIILCMIMYNHIIHINHASYYVWKNWYFWTMVLEKTLENPLDCKEIQSVHPKGNQSWIFIGRMGAKAETPILRPPDEKKLTYWKRPFWERLTAGGEGDDRAWDGWMASPTEWTWVWVGSGSWWWTGKLGVLQSMGPQRVGRTWVTELTGLTVLCIIILVIAQLYVSQKLQANVTNEHRF